MNELHTCQCGMSLWVLLCVCVCLFLSFSIYLSVYLSVCMHVCVGGCMRVFVVGVTVVCVCVRMCV